MSVNGDVLLLESSLVDGYLLEDGSGVLLLDGVDVGIATQSTVVISAVDTSTVRVRTTLLVGLFGLGNPVVRISAQDLITSVVKATSSFSQVVISAPLIIENSFKGQPSFSQVVITTPLIVENSLKGQPSFSQVVISTLNAQSVTVKTAKIPKTTVTDGTILIQSLGPLQVNALIIDENSLKGQPSFSQVVISSPLIIENSLKGQPSFSQVVISSPLIIENSLKGQPSFSQVVISAFLVLVNSVHTAVAVGAVVITATVNAEAFVPLVIVDGSPVLSVLQIQSLNVIASTIKGQPSFSQVVISAPVVVENSLKGQPSFSQVVISSPLIIENSLKGQPSFNQIVISSPLIIENSLKGQPSFNQIVISAPVIVENAFKGQPSFSQVVISALSIQSVTSKLDFGFGQLVIASLFVTPVIAKTASSTNQVVISAPVIVENAFKGQPSFNQIAITAQIVTETTEKTAQVTAVLTFNSIEILSNPIRCAVANGAVYILQTEIIDASYKGVGSFSTLKISSFTSATKAGNVEVYAQIQVHSTVTAASLKGQPAFGVIVVSGSTGNTPVSNIGQAFGVVYIQTLAIQDIQIVKTVSSLGTVAITANAHTIRVRLAQAFASLVIGANVFYGEGYAEAVAVGNLQVLGVVQPTRILSSNSFTNVQIRSEVQVSLLHMAHAFSSLRITGFGRSEAGAGHLEINLIQLQAFISGGRTYRIPPPIYVKRISTDAMDLRHNPTNDSPVLKSTEMSNLESATRNPISNDLDGTYVPDDLALVD